MQRSIITIERKKLVDFLTEIEIFLLTYLPNLCEECSASNEIQNLKQVLSEPHLDFDAYTICMQQFVLNVRNCVRMRASFIGNPQTESTRIHIEHWHELKKGISNETPKEELVSIANKLIDEAFVHLSEILLNMLLIRKT